MTARKRRYTESQKQAIKRYMDKTDLISIRVEKGMKSKYRQYAKGQGETLTSLFKKIMNGLIDTSQEQR